MEKELITQEIRNTIYDEACRILESEEYAGQYIGNSHHGAQEIQKRITDNFKKHEDYFNSPTGSENKNETFIQMYGIIYLFIEEREKRQLYLGDSAMLALKITNAIFERMETIGISDK